MGSRRNLVLRRKIRRDLILNDGDAIAVRQERERASQLQQDMFMVVTPAAG